MKVRKWTRIIAKNLAAGSQDPTSLSGTFQDGGETLVLTVGVDGLAEGEWKDLFGTSNITGTVDSGCLSFTWRRKRTETSFSSPQNGFGLLVLSGEQLTGYTAEGEWQLDAWSAKNWKEKKFSKVKALPNLAPKQ